MADPVTADTDDNAMFRHADFTYQTDSPRREVGRAAGKRELAPGNS